MKSHAALGEKLVRWQVVMDGTNRRTEDYETGPLHMFVLRSRENTGTELSQHVVYRRTLNGGPEKRSAWLISLGCHGAGNARGGYNSPA